MLARELAEKAERAQHAREEDERRAIAAERNRIARELHDVLAHNLSVMVVQAGGRAAGPREEPGARRRGRRADRAHRPRGARRDPAPVRRRCGAASGEPLSGAQSIARVDELARRARAAGLRVELRVTGDPVELPGGHRPGGLPDRPGGAHQHAQALAGRARPRHGRLRAERGGARASRTTARAPREDYELGDAGGGHGLVGMRERAAVYGGVVQAGRAPRRRLRRARAAPRATRAGASFAGGAGMSIRVLLVDDQALIRAGFRMILDAEEDMEVVGECADGTQAVDSARRLDARRRAHGHPHAGDGRHRGHPPDRGARAARPARAS